MIQKFFKNNPFFVLQISRFYNIDNTFQICEIWDMVCNYYTRHLLPAFI